MRLVWSTVSIQEGGPCFQTLIFLCRDCARKGGGQVLQSTYMHTKLTGD